MKAAAFALLPPRVQRRASSSTGLQTLASPVRRAVKYEFVHRVPTLMLHGAELAGGGRPASLLARRPTRTAAVAGKGTSSPCEHQLAWAGLAKASSRHRALRSPTPSFPPFPFVTGGATVAAFLHSELAPRPLPFHVPSPTFACVPLARAWRAAQRQAERRRRHGPPRRVSANAPRAACAFAVFGCQWQ